MGKISNNSLLEEHLIIPVSLKIESLLNKMNVDIKIRFKNMSLNFSEWSLKKTISIATSSTFILLHLFKITKFMYTNENIHFSILTNVKISTLQVFSQK